jgi:hypothetical protein
MGRKERKRYVRGIFNTLAGNLPWDVVFGDLESVLYVTLHCFCPFASRCFAYEKWMSSSNRIKENLSDGALESICWPS